MVRRTVSEIMLVLLLIGLFALAFNVKPVGASGTIYIRADGSIDPPTAPISTVDNVTYTLTGNITTDADGIIVERDYIVVDGEGYTVQGTGASGSEGIGMFGRSNVTIKNMKITTFDFGIYLSESSNNSLSRNNITANNDGLIIQSSSDNVLRNNNMFNNKYNFGVGYGSQLVNDVDISNIVDGKPIYYWVNEADRAVPTDAGCVILVNSTQIMVRNLNLTNNLRGIHLISTIDSTIVENSIANNEDGIFLYESSFNKIYDNNITTNKYHGIRVDYLSDNNIISGNSIRNNTGLGISIGSNNNIVSENHIAKNGDTGVEISFSSNETLSGNVLEGNGLNFNIWGWRLDEYLHFIDESNLVDGNPVYYLVSQAGMVISSAVYPQIGWLALVNCSKIEVTNLTLSHNGEGLLIAFSNYSRITGNNIIDNEYGIYVDWSLGCSISDNTVRNCDNGIRLGHSPCANISRNIIGNNKHYGIEFYETSNSTISANTIAMNSWFNIDLGSSSDNNTISGNVITDSGYGIEIYVCTNNTICENTIMRNVRGVDFAYSSSNNILRNNIVSNSYGINMYDLSDFNVFRENNITNNYIGICARAVYDSGFPLNNSFFHNNFNDNTIQTDTENSLSIWDNGYPSGGNYWSDYMGLDSDHDGIGDTPYIIDANNTDNYPLIRLYVQVLGDVNDDGLVDIYDAILLAVCFNSTPDNPDWNPNADFNGDGLIDIFDAIVLASNFGKTG